MKARRHYPMYCVISLIPNQYHFFKSTVVQVQFTKLHTKVKFKYEVRIVCGLASQLLHDFVYYNNL